MPTFGVFNVKQVEWEHAHKQGEALKKLGVERVYISDSEHFHHKGEKVEGVEFEATFDAKRHCLYVHMPQLSEGAGLTESALAVRVLSFIEPKPEVLIVTNKAAVTGIRAVRDVIYISGLNPLRGENCEKFGPRFPDLSQIYNKKIVEKLGYPEVVLMLTLDAGEETVMGNVCYGGALQHLLTLVHQKSVV